MHTLARIVLPLFVIIVVFVLFGAFRHGGGLIRGVVDNMLISPARPAIAVRPDSHFILLDARRANAVPPAADGSLEASRPSATFWYAIYQNREQQETLIAMLGETDSPFRWRHDASAPVRDEHIRPNPNLWQETRYSLQNHLVNAITFILPVENNIWGDPQDRIVRRFAFSFFQDKVRLVVEYHENAQNLHDPVQIAKFEHRAEKAFFLEDKDLPKPQKNLEYPPSGLSQKKFAAYMGKVWQAEGRP